mmetsp:Transcript_23678/g.27407  ORF Transcript_23678/g.27407 Transcript_23678/m.27407 type:complete len:232 (+) Transcript_23678:620-1315(+)
MVSLKVSVLLRTGLTSNLASAPLKMLSKTSKRLSTTCKKKTLLTSLSDSLLSERPSPTSQPPSSPAEPSTMMSISSSIPSLLSPAQPPSFTKLPRTSSSMALISTTKSPLPSTCTSLETGNNSVSISAKPSLKSSSTEPLTAHSVPLLVKTSLSSLKVSLKVSPLMQTSTKSLLASSTLLQLLSLLTKLSTTSFLKKLKEFWKVLLSSVKPSTLSQQPSRNAVLLTLNSNL